MGAGDLFHSFDRDKPQRMYRLTQPESQSKNNWECALFKAAELVESSYDFAGDIR